MSLYTHTPYVLMNFHLVLTSDFPYTGGLAIRWPELHVELNI